MQQERTLKIVKTFEPQPMRLAASRIKERPDLFRVREANSAEEITAQMARVKALEERLATNQSLPPALVLAVKGEPSFILFGGHDIWLAGVRAKRAIDVWVYSIEQHDLPFLADAVREN